MTTDQHVHAPDPSGVTFPNSPTVIVGNYDGVHWDQPSGSFVVRLVVQLGEDEEHVHEIIVTESMVAGAERWLRRGARVMAVGHVESRMSIVGCLACEDYCVGRDPYIVADAFGPDWRRPCPCDRSQLHQLRKDELSAGLEVGPGVELRHCSPEHARGGLPSEAIRPTS